MVKEINQNEFENLIKEGYSFVDFFASWCYPCMMMMPIVDEVSNELTNVNFYKINTDSNIDLSKKFNVQSIPRFLIFKDGVLLNTLIGARDKDQLIREIKECLK